METAFTSEFFAGNRERLREFFTGTAPIVLTANGLVQRGADDAYPFHQDASFWYFTGCDEPDVILVCEKDKEYLIVPERSKTREIFEGAVDEAELRRLSGIDTVLNERQGWKQLGAKLKKAKHAAVLPAGAAYMGHYGMYANPARRYLTKRMQTYNGQIELLDISQHVARLRMVKQPVELAAIQKAIRITMMGLKEVMKPSKRNGYAYEYEIAAKLTRSFRLHGASGDAFAPTVAGGVRACVMHNRDADHALSADELLLCDTGAMYNHYAADITRTYSIGIPSRLQEAVYDAVIEVEDYAINLLKPGVLMKEYEAAVEQFMGEKLRTVGLIKTIDHDVVRQFYPHATSHFLGLNPHDSGLYDRPLEPGVVLTVEPGIYISAMALGVRIEDDVVITNDGNRVLSGGLSRDLV